MRIYVSGKYTAPTTEARDENVNAAAIAAKQLLAMGHAPYCPHTMCRGWEEDGRFNDEQFLAMDFAWIEASDALLMLARWEESPGARLEREFAEKRGIAVYYDLADVPAS
jgi:hypothetical protein